MQHTKAAMAVAAGSLFPTLPTSCPPELLQVFNQCFSYSPEDRATVPMVLQAFKQYEANMSTTTNFILAAIFFFFFLLL
jgi:hypothetical protein